MTKQTSTTAVEGTANELMNLFTNPILAHARNKEYVIQLLTKIEAKVQEKERRLADARVKNVTYYARAEERKNALHIAKMFSINKMAGEEPSLIIPESQYKHYLSIDYKAELGGKIDPDGIAGLPKNQCTDCGAWVDDDYKKTHELECSAIREKEKMIAIGQSDYIGKDEAGFDHYKCPSCKGGMVSFSSSSLEYCPKCGKKLSWGESK